MVHKIKHHKDIQNVKVKLIVLVPRFEDNLVNSDKYGVIKNNDELLTHMKGHFAPSINSGLLEFKEIVINSIKN